MKFCKHCGAQIEDTVAFCPNCGTDVSESAVNTGASEPIVEPAPQYNAYHPEQPQNAAPYQPYQTYQNPGVYPEGKLNGLAIAGFIVSIASFFICGISSIVGLILSIIGMVQIKNSVKAGVPQRGNGFAIAGLVLGIIGVVFIVIYIIMVAAAAATLPWVTYDYYY